MTGCWWPCCGDTYNLRRYDESFAVVWSATALAGNEIQCIAIDGTDLYVAGTGTDNARNVFEKYDISGGSPVLEWGITRSYFRSNDPSWTGTLRLAVNSTGDVILLSQGGITGQSGKIYKFNSSGVIQWITSPTTTMENATSVITLPLRVIDLCLDSSDYIYLATEYPLAAIPGGLSLEKWTINARAIVNVAKLNPDSSVSWMKDSQDFVTLWLAAGYGTASTRYSPTVLNSEFTNRVITTDGTRVFLGCTASASTALLWAADSSASITAGPARSTRPAVMAVNCLDGLPTWGSATLNTGADLTGVNSIAWSTTNGRVIVGRAGAMRSYVDTTGVFSRNLSSITNTYSKALDFFRDANETAPDDMKIFLIKNDGASAAPQRWTYDDGGSESLTGEYGWHSNIAFERCIKSYYPGAPLGGYSTIVGGKLGTS